MNMLDEIRRERACELFGEGFRSDDLKRWGYCTHQPQRPEIGSSYSWHGLRTEKQMMPLTLANPVIILKNIRCSTASIKEAAPMIPTMDVPLLHWQATCFSASAIICLPFLWYRFV